MTTPKCKVLIQVALVALAAVFVGALPRASDAQGTGKPLPAEPTARIQRDFDKLRLQWNLATSVEAYKQVGLRSPAWDDAALKLLDAWARAFQTPVKPAQVVEAGQAAVKLGCNDPLVLYALATGLNDSGQYAEAETVAARAVEGLQQVTYPHCRVWGAAQLSAALYRRSGKVAEADQQTALCVRWIAQAAAEKAVTDGYQRQFWARLSAALDDSLADQYKAVCDALHAQAGADPWIVAMCDGTYRVQRTWFDRAVAAQLDWIPAYTALEEALRIRWGGSDEAMYAFGLECLATKRFDTAVPYQLRRCLRYISEEDDGDDWWFKPGVYANVRAMFEGLLGDPTNGLDANRLRGQYTATAWQCGAYEDASRQWGILGYKMDAGTVQQEIGEIIPFVVGGVIACTGPQAAAAKEAEGLSTAEVIRGRWHASRRCSRRSRASFRSGMSATAWRDCGLRRRSRRANR